MIASQRVEHLADHVVEPAAGVAIGRRQEFIVEAEAVEEAAAASHCCAAAKLSWVPNGSGIWVSGLPRFSASIAWLGTLSGTLRSPSMSSLNAISRVG